MTVPISYNIADAADATGYSTDVIRRAIKAGELVAHFPTSKGVITAEDLHAWINQAPTARVAS